VTYFLAFVDCLPWIENEDIGFWLDLLSLKVKCLGGEQEKGVWKRVWEVVSSESGLGGVEWWVNGGREKVMGGGGTDGEPRL
jgi:hypothetical protein